MSFRKLRIEDKTEYEKYFLPDKRRGCEYTFACNFIWQDVYRSTFDIIENCYVARTDRDGKYVYNLPLGEKEDVVKAVKAIIDIEKENTVIRGILDYHIPFLIDNFGDIFDFSYNRNESDYIYLSENLISLSGKKYQSKRNLIKRFKDNPNWSFEPITHKNVNECINLNHIWSDSKNVDVSEDMRIEIGAANTALAHFDALGLKGGLIRQNEKVVAYSIGEKLTDDTFVIHFEKALDIKGCYQTINNEFASAYCKDFKYVNREEDAGEEGLRKAKLSYNPEILLHKYEARIKC